ncbi:transglutaminase domain-containing protein [Candidatus Woesearchaeota archaeon]|nr:transglutaminase domain-containing protein [Candidatus Woesearchaeota archaeon]
MKKILILIVLLLALPLINAYEQEEILNAQEITTKIELSSELQLIEKGPMYKIEQLYAELYNFPQDDINQRVLKLETTPQAEKKDDMLRYRWISPKEKSLKYQLTSTVKTQNMFNPIKEKITYPVRKELDRGYDVFLKPSLYIDSSNEEIKAKAKSIIAEEDDLYIIVSKIANWVNKQVEYNINTKTEKVTQKASWVMQNKQGVCDEITSLFIGLLRAADIPARFVSGISYANIPNTQQNSSPHGWAEVYYPERGWLPYDITFGQYGRIDPGHIKLKETLDPQEKPIRFEWHGRDAGIEPKELQVFAEIQEIKGKIEPIIEINTKIAKEKTGIGSYNLVIAEITNLKDHYITKELILADVNEIEIKGTKKKLSILKPRETQKLFWRIQVKPELDQEYGYEIPIEVYTQWGDQGKTKFRSRRDYEIYSLNDIVKIQDSTEKGKLEIKQKDELKEPEQKKEAQSITTEQEELIKKPGIIQKIIKWIKSLFS